MKNKVVFIDWGIFVHRSIFATLRTEFLNPLNLSIKMILSCLKLIDLTEDDLIIIAADTYQNNWRKEIDSNYKSNRQELREKASGNWTQYFEDFDELLNNINKSTPFHVLKIETLEADDIIAYGVRYYKETECVIVSNDSDFDQLTKFDNVKLFSPVSKKYKIIKNPHRTLVSKIQKETTDNLVTPILNQKDYEIRKKLVDLVNLPEFVEQKVELSLNCLQTNKKYNLDNFQIKKIRDDIMEIYKNEKTVSIYDSFKQKRKKVKLEQMVTLDSF